MADYKELVSVLRSEADGFLMADAPDVLMADSLKSAADAIEELLLENDALGRSLCECDDLLKKLERPKWISVEERLPEFDQEVLAWVKNKDPEGRFNRDGTYVAELKDKTPEPDPEGKKNFWGIPGYDSKWTVWAWSYFSEPEVTHWMPLPEPPKKEEHDETV